MGFLRVEVSDPGQARLVAATLGLTIRQMSADQRVLSLTAPPGTDLNALLARLQGDPRVTSAKVDALGFVPPAR